ncbi:hypothetical protein D3C85_1610030 [compost metagenome]
MADLEEGVWQTENAAIEKGARLFERQEVELDDVVERTVEGIPESQTAPLERRQGVLGHADEIEAAVDPED